MRWATAPWCDKKDIGSFTCGLTFFLIKTFSHQTKSWISPISQYCGSGCSFCGSTISFMSSSDVVNQEFVVFAGKLLVTGIAM